MVAVPLVPFDQTLIVSPQPAETETPRAPAAPTEIKPAPVICTLTVEVTSVAPVNLEAVEVRVSDALRGSINIVPTTRGLVAVPALTTRVESAAMYPRPLFLSGAFATAEVSFKYSKVFAATPVVSAAVTVTEKLAAFSTVTDAPFPPPFPLWSETV